MKENYFIRSKNKIIKYLRLSFLFPVNNVYLFRFSFHGLHTIVDIITNFQQLKKKSNKLVHTESRINYDPMWLIYAREFCGMPKPDTFLLFLNYDQDLVIFLHIYGFIRKPIHKIFIVIKVDVI